VGVGGAGSEHGDQRIHGLGELAPTPLRALRQPSDLARRLQPAIRVVQLDELERALDGRGRGMRSLQRAVGLGIGVRAVALGGALHRRKVGTRKIRVVFQEKRKVGVALSNSHKRGEVGGWSVRLFLFFLFIFLCNGFFFSFLFNLLGSCWSCRSVTSRK
jgi:hypothetical protein